MGNEVKKEGKYAQLGVDANKESVRKAFSQHIDNEFPYAFVNIIRDPLKRGWFRTQHMDGDGSRFVQRLLIYAETGDKSVLRGAVDDALQMNLGDIAASGFVFGPIMVTDVININGHSTPKNIIMEEVGQRFGELMDMYRSFGFDIRFLGGETADLTTQVKSIAFDVAVSAHAKRKDIIAGNIRPDDKIYGFASDGQASWEEVPNSGIMSNGLTLGRVSAMWKGYGEKYPHLGIYQGRFKVGERVAAPFDLVVSDALISPTRQWAILLKVLLEELQEAGAYKDLHGISMNTGGGATKISHVGNGITYQKEMPFPPELFYLLQIESGESWEEMYRDFNCGVGLDVVGKSSDRLRDALQKVSDKTQVQLFELGECAASSDGKNHVFLQTEQGDFEY